MEDDLAKKKKNLNSPLKKGFIFINVICNSFIGVKYDPDICLWDSPFVLFYPL